MCFLPVNRSTECSDAFGLLSRRPVSAGAAAAARAALCTLESMKHLLLPHQLKVHIYDELLILPAAGSHRACSPHWLPFTATVALSCLLPQDAPAAGL